MSDLPTPDHSEELPKDDHPPTKDGLIELRSLILGQEQTQLAKLQERLDNPKLHAKDVSRVLPEAIVLRSTQDRKLATALMSTVEEVVKSSIKKDPKTLVDTLFPVMGPAIRKAISETIWKMLQSFNQALEKSLSWNGLKWRMEALRTGKSFAEVVLLHSLVYRVEQVFLIHKETGLLLQHVVGESVAFQDADMVSGMLTAIQDFVRDSFEIQSEDGIETIRLGELTVWINQGPELVLAGAIRGNPPEELRSVFQETLENIHLEQSNALESFDGDVASFETSRHHLETCLQARFRTKEQRFSLFFWIILVAVLLALGVWAFFSVRNNLRWADYLAKINAEQGIVVTAAEKRHGKYCISGLRDPLAADTMALLKEAKLDPKKVISRWEPYHSLHPEFIIARAKKILNPPESVLLELKHDILYATGFASHQWIVKACSLGRAIPGISQFREENLIDTDLRNLTLSKKWVEDQKLRFEVNTTDLVPGQSDILHNLAKEIQELHDFAQLLSKRLYVKIVGHTDQTGSEKKNLNLSQERADFILSVLIAEGLKTINCKTVGVGASEPLSEEVTEKDRECNRRVSFKVVLSDMLITKEDKP